MIVPEASVDPVDLGPVVEEATLILPPPVENRNAAILGGRLAYRTKLYNGTNPLEGYTFSGSAVQDPTPDTSDDPVRDTTASIINVPGWPSSKWVRTLGQGHSGSVLGGLRDEFVVFTDRDGASDMHYMNLAYWIRYHPVDAVPFEGIHTISMISVGSTKLLPGVGEFANGNATYSGPAIGLYAKQGGGLYQEHGEFRAQAALSVDFDAMPPAGGAHWKPPISVSGTISDFRDAQGNVIDNSWNVTLQEHLYDGSNGSRRSPHEYRTGTTGGGNRYMFHFFGPATADANNDTNPEYMGGSFRESFGNGAVSGAFAAKRDEP